MGEQRAAFVCEYEGDALALERKKRSVQTWGARRDLGKGTVKLRGSHSGLVRARTSAIQMFVFLFVVAFRFNSRALRLAPVLSRQRCLLGSGRRHLLANRIHQPCGLASSDGHLPPTPWRVHRRAAT